MSTPRSRAATLQALQDFALSAQPPSSAANGAPHHGAQQQLDGASHNPTQQLLDGTRGNPSNSRSSSSAGGGGVDAAPRPTGAVARLVSPPFGGSDWEWVRFWAGWLVAPGVLVALQVVETCSQEPWFVIYVAWLGEDLVLAGWGRLG